MVFHRLNLKLLTLFFILTCAVGYTTLTIDAGWFPTEVNLTEQLLKANETINTLRLIGFNVSNDEFYLRKALEMVNIDYNAAYGLASTLFMSLNLKKLYYTSSSILLICFLSLISSLTSILVFSGRSRATSGVSIFMALYLAAGLLGSPLILYSSYLARSILSFATNKLEVPIGSFWFLFLGFIYLPIELVVFRVIDNPFVNFALAQIKRHRLPWSLTIFSSLLIASSMFLMIHVNTEVGVSTHKRWRTSLKNCILLGSPQGVNETCIKRFLVSGRLPAASDEAVMIDRYAQFYNAKSWLNITGSDAAILPRVRNYRVVGLLDFDKTVKYNFIGGSLRRKGSVLLITKLEAPSIKSKIVFEAGNISSQEISEFIDRYSLGRVNFNGNEAYYGYFAYHALDGYLYEYSKDYIPITRDLRSLGPLFLIPAFISFLIHLSSMLSVVHFLKNEIKTYAVIGINPRSISNLFKVQGLTAGLISSTYGLYLSIIITRLFMGVQLVVEPFWMLTVIACVTALSLLGVSFPAGRASKIVTPSREIRWRLKKQSVLVRGKIVSEIPVKISIGEIEAFLRFIEERVIGKEPGEAFYVLNSKPFIVKLEDDIVARGFIFEASYKPREEAIGSMGVGFKGKIYILVKEGSEVKVYLSLGREKVLYWSTFREKYLRMGNLNQGIS